MSAIRDALEDACKETTELVVAYMRKRVAEGATAKQLADEIERGDFWPPGEPDFS